MRNRGYALQEMDRLDQGTFKRMFQVDRATFDELLELVAPLILHRDAQKAVNSSGTPIHPK
jgi:hypothetical protein